MQAETRALWRGVRPLLGTMIGAGVFALPYVFAQSGFGIGLIELVVIASLNLVALIMYAQVVLVRRRHAHVVEVIGGELGFVGRWIAIITFFGSMWGAMTAYVILGGGFLASLLEMESVIGSSLLFVLAASLLVFGGLNFVSQAQAVLIPALYALMLGLFVSSLPHFSLENVLAWHPKQAMVPLGVIMFAVGGISAIPEMRDLLGRRERLLPGAIGLGTAIGILMYCLFILAVLGMNGGTTTPDAIGSIARVAGPEVGLLASAIGLLIMTSAFMTLGTSIMQTLHYDFRVRFVGAWALAVGVPVTVFMLGARDFISVIGTSGGVFGAIIGLLIMFAYEEARRSGELPKRSLRIPSVLALLCAMLYVGMLAVTLVG